MANLNKVMLIGNLGKDAELRYLTSGKPRAEFSLAVNHNKKNPEGKWESETEWFNVTLFGDTAERLSPHLVKGKQAYVEGRFQTRKWDDDQGQKHYRTEVIANIVQLLEKRDKQDEVDGLPFE